MTDDQKSATPHPPAGRLESPMTPCKLTLEQLNAWVDGELPPPEAADVSAHLDVCADCRVKLEDLKRLDEQLRQWGAGRKSAAERIASRVLAAGHNQAPTAPPEDVPQPLSSTRRTKRFQSVAVCAIMLLLAAALLIRHSLRDDPAMPPVADVPAPPAPRAGPAPHREAVARITAATGPVSLQSRQDADWQLVSVEEEVHCLPGTSIRTSEGVLCEVETQTGAIVRLNVLSLVTITSPDEVSLLEGEIYCSTGPERELNVRGDPRPSPTLPAGVPAEPVPVFSCPVDSGCSIALPSRLETRVMCSTGRVDIDAGGSKTQLTPGTAVELRNGTIEIKPAEDVLLSTAWIQPLLLVSDRRRAELEERVDALLARIGQTKVSHLYEEQIRSLGEPGAWPLVRFLRRTQDGTPLQRQKAARILSQTATSAMVGDLLRLLDDADPQIRVSTAAALQRVTGLHRDLSPQSWADPLLPEREAAEADWHVWWNQFGQ